RAVPGVVNATACPFLPLMSGPAGAIDWSTDALPSGPPGSRAASLQVVLPGYFETLRTRLIAGRTFDRSDNLPGRNVAIIDELVAARGFPGRSAVGRRIR